MNREIFNRILAYWKKGLGLDSWQIAVIFEQPEPSDRYPDGAMMSVTRSNKYDNAALYVAPYVVGEGNWPSTVEAHLASKHFLEAKVIHELLHLALRNLVFIPEVLLEGMLHRDVYTIHLAAADLEEERTVDHISIYLQESFGWYRIKKSKRP